MTPPVAACPPTETAKRRCEGRFERLWFSDWLRCALWCFEWMLVITKPTHINLLEAKAALKAVLGMAVSLPSSCFLGALDSKVA